MTFEERKMRAIAIMDSKKMWRSNYAPPLLRLLWWLGLKIPPLPYLSFWQNLLLTGPFFGTCWGTVMWFISWRTAGIKPATAVIMALSAALLFGLCMASFHWWRKKVNQLPDWKNLDKEK
ncbi:DUF6404 family protein [Serratia ficaria]|uniref:DUF6404 family protein n=1 Tax=Serratia ficaria TaxID=61651 RepID=UPI0021C78C51|nr:DUF6404 family protein [Serratia ficaria]